MATIDKRTGKPKVNIANLLTFSLTEAKIKAGGLRTICESGLCPNKRECWGRGTATFMILGEVCTRNCLFCGVSTGYPSEPDRHEINELVDTIKAMMLKHVVLTSVTRDDLADKGAGYWAETIRKVKQSVCGVTIEALIPDFGGESELISQVLNEKPEIASHNIETVERLNPVVRSRAHYLTSLNVIRHIRESGCCTKSGLMLGLGETLAEVKQTLEDLRKVGCEILTIGQYYSPSTKHYPVKEIVETQRFEELSQFARSIGFSHVESGPLVRTSYHSDKQLLF